VRVFTSALEINQHSYIKDDVTMAMIFVEAEYPTYISGEVTLPADKVWSDVANWHVKWAICFITFKDGTGIEFSLNRKEDGTDWKRPSHASVRMIGEDEFPDYGAEPIAEQD
jgi:hypothetical protein